MRETKVDETETFYNFLSNPWNRNIILHLANWLANLLLEMVLELSSRVFMFFYAVSLGWTSFRQTIEFPVNWDPMTLLWQHCNDVIKWKHFPRNFLLCGEFIGPRWILCTKTSDAELWCFIWSAAEYTVVQTIVKLVIWGAIAPIMTSS